MNFFQKVLNKLDWWYNVRKSKNCIGMPGIQVLSFDESIEYIVNNESSLTRFGDGEFSLILNGEFLRYRNKSLRFQKADPLLKRRLEEILKDNEIDKYNIKIAISSPLVNYDLNTYTDEAWHFWKNFLIENRYKIYRKLRKDYPYIDTLITRFYMDFRDKGSEVMLNKITQLRRLWNGKDVLIVEGTGSRLGLNNNLFDNVSSIQRIACPNENAYDKYLDILNITKQYGKGKLIIIALGPTATVLTYDLARDGFRALDLGHIDIEYEWFLRKSTTKVPITGKVMSEVEEDTPAYNLIQSINETYNKQLIHKIDF